MQTHETVRVSGQPGYDVLIGRAMLDDVVNGVPQQVAKILLVHQTALQVASDTLAEALRAKGFEVFQAAVPDGEDAKRIEVASWCWGLLGQSDFSRSDLVIGFGGSGDRFSRIRGCNLASRRWLDPGSNHIARHGRRCHRW